MLEESAETSACKVFNLYGPVGCGKTRWLLELKRAYEAKGIDVEYTNGYNNDLLFHMQSFETDILLIDRCLQPPSMLIYLDKASNKERPAKARCIIVATYEEDFDGEAGQQALRRFHRRVAFNEAFLGQALEFNSTEELVEYLLNAESDV